jgi:PAS domain S-box-containing protein
MLNKKNIQQFIYKLFPTKKDPKLNPNIISQAIFETSSESILTIDHNNIIQSINNSLSEIFQYAPEELIGKNIHSILFSPLLKKDSFSSKDDSFINPLMASEFSIPYELFGKKKMGPNFLFLYLYEIYKSKTKNYFQGLYKI